MLKAMGAAALLGGPCVVAGTSRRKFVEVFLRGAANTHLSVDPPLGVKRTNGKFEQAVCDLPVTQVPGKDQLLVGPGFAPAVSAFQTLPTAFVNGILMEITAHDIAFDYMATGRLPLRFPFEPALSAAMGLATGGFPTHVMLNAKVPLGRSSRSAPYLLVGSPKELETMFRLPTDIPFQPESLAAGDELAAALDRGLQSRHAQEAADDVAAWMRARSNIQDVAKRYGESLKLTDDVAKRYGIVRGREAGAPFAGALLILRSGLTPYLSLTLFGFDTHSDELNDQTAAQTAAAGALALFVEDLARTPDPDDATKMLAETTTIVVTSEFTRTPRFNARKGTDHWPTTSAVVLGAGVKDNTVVGATDDNGKAAPLAGGAMITPESFNAAVLKQLGFAERAAEVSDAPLSGVFA
jgi:hypothetical protein